MGRGTDVTRYCGARPAVDRRTRPVEFCGSLRRAVRLPTHHSFEIFPLLCAIRILISALTGTYQFIQINSAYILTRYFLNVRFVFMCPGFPNTFSLSFPTQFWRHFHACYTPDPPNPSLFCHRLQVTNFFHIEAFRSSRQCHVISHVFLT